MMRWSTSTKSRHSAVLTSLNLSVLTALTAACTIGTPDQSAARGSAEYLVPTSVIAPAGPADSALSPQLAALQESYETFANSVGGDLGLAFAAVGSTTVTTFGTLTDGAAWSTSKVPLAIAALRSPGGGDEDDIRAAITASDNAAADRLWDSLGNAPVAAAAVQAVIRDGGDQDTVVQSAIVRSGYSAFGQTQWSVANQARFTAHLPCEADGADVRALMSQLASDQRWGLPSIGAAAKGGWGPNASGKYLVRQLGLLPTPHGTVAIAIAAQPDSGSFSDGTALLTSLSSWLATHAADLPGGQC